MAGRPLRRARMNGAAGRLGEHVPQFGRVPPGVAVTPRPGVYAVIFDAPRQNIRLLEVRGHYHLPGGGVDAGETLSDALEREMREETGYGVRSATYIGQANHLAWHAKLGWLNKLGHFFRVRLTDDADTPTDDEGELIWMPVSTLMAAPVEEDWLPGTTARVAALTQPIFMAHQRWAVQQALNQP